MQTRTPWKKTLPALGLAAVLGLAAPLSAATISWTGNGDGASTYAENNWVISAGTIGPAGVGDAPPANTINGSTPINHDLVVTGGTPGGVTGASPDFDLGAGGTLSVTGGTFRMNTGGSSAGIRINQAGDTADVDLSIAGTGRVITQFMLDVEADVSGNGTLVFNGGGNPVNQSTINLGSTGAVLRFNAETPASFTAEHLSKISINGTPAAAADLIIAPYSGASGSEVSVATVYAQSIRDDAPTRWYRFNEPIDAATMNNSAGTAGDATPTNIGFVQTGLDSRAASFDGTASANLGAVFSPNGNSFSVEALINPSSVTGVNKIVMQQEDSGGTGRTLLFINGSDSEVRSFYGGEATQSGYTAVAGEWLHLVLTVEEGGTNDLVSIYVNGLLAASNLVNGETSNGNWILGAGKGQSDFFFAGLMDEVAIYNRALSAAEVFQHANAAFIPTPAALPAGLALLALAAARRRSTRLMASR